jgi:uncharacterized membrane protein YkvA (DUF1232 family)
LQDEDKMERFLERLERKLSKIPVVGSHFASVPMLISLVRSYIKKEYTDIPMGSLLAIVGGLIYFLSPFDLIPDNIPGVGMLDDGVVIAGVLKLVHDDVDEYEDWQRKNGKRIFEDKQTSKRKEKSSETSSPA